MIKVDCENNQESTVSGELTYLYKELAYVLCVIDTQVTEGSDTAENAIETMTYFLEAAFKMAAVAMTAHFMDDQEKKMTALAGLMAGLDCAKGAVVEASGKTMGELQRYLFKNVRLNKKEEES